MHDSDRRTTFSYLAQELNRFGLSYLHSMEPLDVDPPEKVVIQPVYPLFRSTFRGTLITNGGYNKARGEAVLASGKADLVSFGALFIANPDLPRRFAEGAMLNTPDFTTFYGRGVEGLERGYTDYPFLELDGVAGSTAESGLSAFSPEPAHPPLASLHPAKEGADPVPAQRQRAVVGSGCASAASSAFRRRVFADLSPMAERYARVFWYLPSSDSPSARVFARRSTWVASA